MLGDQAMLVIGASAAEEAHAFRKLLPHSWFLVPGMGAQGGSASQALAGCRKDGLGSLVVSSRSLLYPSKQDPVYENNPQEFIRGKINEMTKALQ